MASNDRTGQTDEAAEGSWSPPRSGATSQRASDDKGGTPDPEQLVDDIEKTREDLAQTLDAIADKVSPKRVMERTTSQAKADAHVAVETVKDSASSAAESAKQTAAAAAASVKSAAATAAEAVKDGVAQAKEKVSGDDDPVRSPLTPATSVEVGAATPVEASRASSPLSEDTVSLPGAQVPSEPAPTTGALADAAGVRVEPAGAEAPSYTSALPPSVASRAPLLAGAGAAVVVLLLLLRRKRR